MIPYHQMTKRDKTIALTAFWTIIIVDIALLIAAIYLTVHFALGFLALIAYIAFVTIVMQTVVAPHMATWQDLANHIKRKLKLKI